MIPSVPARAASFVAPRLFVLLLDLSLTAFAFTCAWLLRYNFAVNPADWHWHHLGGLLGCRLLVFGWLRPYAGIIRHTGLEDARLVSQAIALSSGFAVVGSYLLKRLFGDALLYIPASILTIEFFISVALTVSLRFAIKYLYQLLLSSPAWPGPAGQPKPVLIYGAGALGIHTKDVLRRDRTQPYRVVGFVDDNPAKTGKTVQGVRVYAPGEAAGRFLRSAGKPEVILAINNLPAERRHEITAWLLTYQAAARLVPSSHNWINGRLSPHQIRDVRIEDLLGRPAIRLNDAAVGRLVGGQVVLVTGAAGSIGSELVRQLIPYAPAEIILFDQAESALYDLRFRLLHEQDDGVAHPQLTIRIGDVTNAARMERTFAQYRPAFVFHAAAYKHVPLMEEHPDEAVRVNVLGTRIVADLSVTYRVRQFVLISTDKAVNPTNVMGATKRLAELYVQSLNQPDAPTSFVVTRFGNVLGSSGSVVPLFRRQIAAGGPVTVTHPDVIRYFMTIPEAGQLVLEAATMGQGGDVFVFDMGEPVRIADLARQMIQLSGLEAGKDIAVQFTGLRPGEKLYEELLGAAESTGPTHHPKIRIARPNASQTDQLTPALLRLEQSLLTGDHASLVGVLKEIIPEYVSSNSPYVALDQPRLPIEPAP